MSYQTDDWKNPSEDITRALPHSVGCEKSVLSSMLQDPLDFIPLAIESGLTDQHFYLPNHSTLYGVIADLFAKGQEIELVSLVQFLLDTGRLDRVGGQSGLADIYTYAASPGHFRNHLQQVKEKFAAREIIRISNESIAAVYESPDEIPDTLERLTRGIKEIEGAATAKTNLRERAYAMRFDPNETPPPDESCMMIGDVPIAARGNLTVIQGKSKVGKSAVVAAVLAAAQRGNFHSTADSLCISWSGESTGAIIHLDTEQSRSDWHSLVSRSVTRSGMPEVSPRLVSLPLVMFARSERLAILRESMKFEMEARGGIDAVIIDGIADLCKSPNDEAESLELVSNVHALSQEFKTPIYCILHENPSTEQAKTRGHLGSELNRKAFANLRIDKDTETAISTIYGTDMRKRDIPKEQGFCFAWDDAARMHTFQGRAAGLKAAQRDEKAATEAREYWKPISDLIASKSGQNGLVPRMTPILAAEADRDISGTKDAIKEPTMKKRMQRAETLGVLRKENLGGWLYVPSGQTGQERDK